MKVSKEQLRRIIREAVKAKIREASELEDRVLDLTSPADFIIGAFVHLYEDAHAFDLLASNAWEMMGGTLRDEQMPVPARHEDVDALAAKIAEQVVSDQAVKDIFAKIAKNLIENLMEPV